MGDACNKLAEGGHFFGINQLDLGFFQFFQGFLEFINRSDIFLVEFRTNNCAAKLGGNRFQNFDFIRINSCFKKAVPDTIIANAGIGSIIETADSIYNTFNTNVFGVINTILPAIDFYKKKKDTPEEKSIVIISSLAGYHGLATCPSYSASKAAVKAYGEALRVKLKSEKINVNVVCPGFVRSRLTDQNTCPMPFFMEAPEAAKLIIAGIRQNKAVISFPLPLRFAAWLVSILPNCLSDFIYGRLPNKA